MTESEAGPSTGRESGSGRRASIWERLVAKVTWKRALLACGVVAIIAISVIEWQMDVDYQDQIRRYGFTGVFFISLISNATILFPLPGEVALFAAPGIMGLSGFEVFCLGVVASIGATLGELTAYYAGRWGRAAISEKHQDKYHRVGRGMKRYGSAAIFIFSLTPLPFDLVGIAAGSLRYPRWEFLAYCWAGRLIRELIVVYGGWYGWSSIEGIID